MSKRLEDRSTFIVAMIGLVMLYTMTSAECATGGSCAFANGDLANWVFATSKTLWETFEVFIFG